MYPWHDCAGNPQHHIPLLDSVANGVMVDEFMSLKHDQKTQHNKSNLDGTLLRVHTEVSDSSLRCPERRIARSRM